MESLNSIELRFLMLVGKSNASNAYLLVNCSIFYYLFINFYLFILCYSDLYYIFVVVIHERS